MSNDYIIRFAHTEDIPSIMQFIEREWNENHILAHDEAFFKFQFFGNNRVQFALALSQSGQILGMLGYLGFDDDIYLSMWKVVSGLSDPMVGLKLLDYIIKNARYKHFHSVGINAKTIGIYKFLGYKTGQLDHFAAFNPNCSNFKISTPPDIIDDVKASSRFNFKKVEDVGSLFSRLLKLDFYFTSIPFKSLDYLTRRYKNNPHYEYLFYEITDETEFCGIVVLREVEHEGASAIRIVDVIASANNIIPIINDMAKIIETASYEYMDIYASGLNKKALQEGNFKLISGSDKLVVPNYFSPFEKKNIDIHYVTSCSDEVIFFRGDGDQDCPNRIMIKDC